jgi:hypothetical protein
MEKLKYSILVCAYSNGWQFNRYFYIHPSEKKCTNITQGINIAAQKAVGEYIVIVADSNVLLSFNLLSKIDEYITPATVVLSSGTTNDYKLSPDGMIETEYKHDDPDKMTDICKDLLTKMGWPCNPLNLKLIDGKWRQPQAHHGHDCYIVAMAKEAFMGLGGYDENLNEWGTYHDKFVDRVTQTLKSRLLKGVRIVHQYHRVWKQQEAT